MTKNKDVENDDWTDLWNELVDAGSGYNRNWVIS